MKKLIGSGKNAGRKRREKPPRNRKSHLLQLVVMILDSVR
jgi:hypothetical protein